MAELCDSAVWQAGGEVVVAQLELVLVPLLFFEARLWGWRKALEEEEACDGEQVAWFEDGVEAW